MKYSRFLLIAICSIILSCSDNYTDPIEIDEIDHQKEFLQFLPVSWENNLQESIESVTHWIKFSNNPVTYENLLIVPLNFDGIVGLDQETGSLVWHKRSHEDGGLLDGYGIELIGDIILCKGYYSTIALNALDGSVLWEHYYEKHSGNDQFIETNGDQLFKVAEDEAGQYHIDQADISDGVWEHIYTSDVGVELNFGGTSEAFSIDGNDYLTFETIISGDNLSNLRKMNLLNLSSRSIVWSDTFIANYSTTNKVFMSHDQIIHYNNESGISNVRALNVVDGKESWRVDVPSFHLPFPYLLNDLLYIKSVDKLIRVDLIAGNVQSQAKISLGHTDMFEREGKLYYAGFTHFEDHSTRTGIGNKIAVVDKETMLLEQTILPHHRNNTTVGDEPYGQEVFDNDYSYVGREMVFSQDGKRIFVSGHNEVICLQLEDVASVISHTKLQ